MRYVGEKSLSGIVSRFLSISRWILLAAMIVGVPLEVLVLFHRPEEGTFLHEAIVYIGIPWADERSVAYKVLMLVQTAVIVPALLILLRKLSDLFGNFAKNELFRKKNIDLLNAISKLVLVISAATLNVMALFIGLVLLILTAVFRQGTELQTESDWTV